MVKTCVGRHVPRLQREPLSARVFPQGAHSVSNTSGGPPGSPPLPSSFLPRGRMDALHTGVQMSLAQAVTASRQLLTRYRPHGDEGAGPEGQGGCNAALWPNLWGEHTARVRNVPGWRGSFCRGALS